MIAKLEGTLETVLYRDETLIQLYDNDETEAYPIHWHTCIEMIMPIKNPYSVCYDSRSCVLQEGDILLICPGALHELDACDGERYILQVEISSVTMLKSVEALLTMLYPGILINAKTDPEHYDRIRELFLQIVEEYEKAGVLYDASIYSKVLEIMVLLRRGNENMREPLGASTSKQKEYMEKFMSVCSFINDHCTEDLSLDEISARAGFSKYHFSRLFKQFANVSFYKYLNQRRIEHATRLLINPDLSVTEVSISSGFPSLSSFIRMFKLIKGCTPSEYRALYNL